MDKQQPLIRKTPLTERWVVITRYRQLPGGQIEAIEKADVHDQIEAVIRQARADSSREGGRRGGAAAAAKLTQPERTARARKAAQARWAGHMKKER